MAFELDDSKFEISKRFGNWRYDFTNETLYLLSDDEGPKAVQLENICHKALSYLLKNHGRLVTREELLENVWGVTGVSFSRVYRVISILRGVLNDDAINPLFILTIKKVGFRFTGFESDQDQASGGSMGKVVFYKDFFYQIGFGSVVLAMLIGYMFLGRENNIEVKFQPEVLQSDFSLARDFTIKPDASVIAYIGKVNSESSMTNEEKKNLILIKSDKKEYVTIDLPSELSNVITPSWHPRENKIAYRTAHRTKYCKLWVATLDDDLTKVVNNELVGECSKDYFFSGFVHWTKDGEGLIYSDLATASANMVIFHLNLRTNIVNQLTSPPRSSVGDYHVSESPDGGSILFLRDDSRTLAQLWTMDLDTLEQKMVFKFREGVYPSFVEWDKSGEGFLYKEKDNSIHRIDKHSLKTTLFSNIEFAIESLASTSDGRYFGTVRDEESHAIIKISNPFVEKPTEHVEIKKSALYAFNPMDHLPDALFVVKNDTIQQWYEYKDGRKKLLREYSFSHFNAKQMFSYDGQWLLAWVGPDVWVGKLEEQPKLLNEKGQIFMRPTWGASNTSIFAIEPKNNWSVVSINTDTFEQTIYATGIWVFQQSPDGAFEVIVKVNTDVIVLRDVKNNTYRELLVPDYTRDKEINVVFHNDDIYIKCYRCSMAGYEDAQVIYKFNTTTNESMAMPLAFGRGDHIFGVEADGKELLLDSVTNTNSHRILELKTE